MRNPKLKINASPSLFCLHFLMYLAGILIILSITIAGWLKIFLIGLYCYAWLYTQRLQISLSHVNAIINIYSDIKGRWLLQTNNGQLLIGHLRGDSVITRYGMLLNFSLAKKRLIRTVIIMPDAVDKDSYRQLCVYLQTHAGKSLSSNSHLLIELQNKIR